MQNGIKSVRVSLKLKFECFKSLGLQNQIQPGRPLTGGTDTGGTRSSA